MARQPVTCVEASLGVADSSFFFKLYLSGVGWGHRIYIKKSSKKTINQPKKKDLKLTCVEAFLAGVYWIFFLHHEFQG